MKKILSSFTLLWVLPIKFLKRSKFDNFVGGLIFGAIFSLLVNILTVQIQEKIQKQHILEAVENEITNNTLRANYILGTTHKPDEQYNFLYTLQRYSSSLWDQSSEPLQYVTQLDQKTQIAVAGYYTITVPAHNNLLDRLERLTDEKLLNCDNLFKNLTTEEINSCTQWNQIRNELEKSTALDMAKQGLEVMTIFHPTQDRLNDWFLKLVMGSKSTKILSGK